MCSALLHFTANPRGFQFNITNTHFILKFITNIHNDHIWTYVDFTGEEGDVRQMWWSRSIKLHKWIH